MLRKTHLTEKMILINLKDKVVGLIIEKDTDS